MLYASCQWEWWAWIPVALAMVLFWGLLVLAVASILKLDDGKP
jgi:hypothetical protein